MEQQRKIPERKCVGCNEMKPKRELIRAVKSPGGAVSLDSTGKAAGRGAYICPSPDCLKKARKAKRLERAFKCAVAAEIYDALEAELCHVDR
ncbi:MAG: YlxR family protein [Oscillospiraceae bacterium]|jgi:predicted RNA-binding protein YlxR (DUF448 family)|nr:YlxR family protein [Oscillospiraceae bacterium]